MMMAGWVSGWLVVGLGNIGLLVGIHFREQAVSSSPERLLASGCDCRHRHRRRRSCVVMALFDNILVL